jgi:hypothetical protein
MGSVAHQVAAAVHPVDVELVDPSQRRLQRREIGVNVGDDRYASHADQPTTVQSIGVDGS